LKNSKLLRSRLFINEKYQIPVALPDVQKGPSSKAAGAPGLRSHFGGVGLARGAYSQYVSTTKARERRWRPFSTSGASV